MTADETRDQSGSTPEQTASIIYEQGWLDGLMAMHDNISGRYTLADVGGLAWNQFRRLLRRDAVAGPPSNPYDSGALVEGAPSETCVEVPADAKRIRITGTLASPVVEVLERHTWEGAPTDEQVEREAAERWPALGPDDAELIYRRSVLRAFCRDSFREGAKFAYAGVAPPAPSADREKLIAKARSAANYLDAADAQEIEAWGGGNFTTSDLRQLAALATPAPVEWEYAVQFKEAGGGWTQPTWTNLATAERIERWHGPADLESVMVRRKKAGAPEVVSDLDSLRGEG